MSVSISYSVDNAGLKGMQQLHTYLLSSCYFECGENVVMCAMQLYDILNLDNLAASILSELRLQTNKCTN